MAKVAKMPGTINTSVPLILEDPRSSKDVMFLYGVKHDKNSLTPYFNKSIRNMLSVTNTQPQNTTTTNFSSKLLLNKPTTHVGDWYTTGNGSSTSYNFPDESAWIIMDETKEQGVIKTITDVNNSATTYYWSDWNDQYTYAHGSNAITENGEWEDLTTDYATSNARYGASWTPIVVGYNRVYGFHSYSGSTSSWSWQPNYTWAYLGTNWPTASASFSYTSSYNIGGKGNYWTPQYIGQSSLDNSTLVVQTSSYTSSDSTRVHVTKNTFTSSATPTYTVLLSSTGGVTVASGTHQGGYNMNNKRFRKNCSHLFTDPRDANKKAFYYPYFDQYGDFHPFVCTWDTTTDVVALEEDISITGDKSSAHASFLTETTYGFCDGVTVDTWVAGGTRYVAYIPWDTAQYASSGAAFKTIITYSVDAADPKALTYHSKIELPDSPRNYVWLNDTRTMMGVFLKNSFVVLAWNVATGWAITTTIPERVSACGRDSLDRIWYSTNNSEINLSYQDLNLLSPTLPVTVTITPESTDNQYTGVVIDTYVDVSAYNTAGARIAASVKLVIDSASVTFADGTKAKTVTTLTSGELQVATKINGAGYSNITASIQL